MSHRLSVVVGVAAGHPQPTTNVDVQVGKGPTGRHLISSQTPSVFCTVFVTVGQWEPPGMPAVVMLVTVALEAEVMVVKVLAEEWEWCLAREVGRALWGGGSVSLDD